MLERHGVSSPRQDALVCFCHLRWSFVFQRPQHIMRRLARGRRVFFVEEPRVEGPTRLETTEDAHGVTVVVPHLDPATPESAREPALRRLMDALSAERGLEAPIAWYYSPMFLDWTRHLPAVATVYDCMDELSAFAFAPPRLRALEAELRPDWHVVLVGPVVKIDPAAVPRRPNLHCLGQKTYAELPAYLAGWDVALLPFARNDATRFISPTKTPEYMAGGRPVVSTSIRDVVRPYGEQGLVHIADDAPGFVAAVERVFAEDPAARRRAHDAFLQHQSWDETVARMASLLDRAPEVRRARAARA